MIEQEIGEIVDKLIFHGKRLLLGMACLVLLFLIVHLIATYIGWLIVPIFAGTFFAYVIGAIISEASLTWPIKRDKYKR